jgi:hypothetical protein
MPPLVFFSVMLDISAGSLPERNDRLHVVGAQPAGIKSLIADQGQAMDAGHESAKLMMSRRWPGKSTKLIRLPSASTITAIFVVRPPRDLRVASQRAWLAAGPRPQIQTAGFG